MSIVRRWGFGMAILAALAAAGPTGVTAQTAERPIPAGLYRFVPEQSDEIAGKVDEAVAHMNFLIRGIARGRLKGANQPIDQIDIRYSSDTVWISLRADEPWVVSTLDGEYAPYTRADGEVVQVKADVEPGVIDQYFLSDDGEKQMIYRLRDDGMLELESIVYSEKLRAPFRYTWVYRPIERPAEADGGTGSR